MPVQDNEEMPYLYTTTEDIKLVADYTGLDFSAVELVDCLTFRMLLRDAYIYKLRQTPDGIDYLKKAWLITRTQCDVDKLKQLKDGVFKHD